MLTEKLTASDEEFKRTPDTVLKCALGSQERAMETRASGREDPKFQILQQFNQIMAEGHSFQEAYEALEEPEKHAIITRLQNESDAFGGSIPIAFIDILEEDLYGPVHSIERTQRKNELEKAVANYLK